MIKRFIKASKYWKTFQSRVTKTVQSSINFYQMLVLSNSHISFQDHLLTCGQVLEKCSYNCLAYIQRKNMDKHLKVCSKRPQASIQNGLQRENSEMSNDKMSMLEENLMFLRKSLNEEIQMRHDMIEELGSLKKRNQVCDFEMEKLMNCCLTKLWF